MIRINFNLSFSDRDATDEVSSLDTSGSRWVQNFILFKDLMYS